MTVDKIYIFGFNKLVSPSPCFHRERNNRYAEIYRNRMGNDKYVDRSTQTLNGASKNKQVQSDSIVTADSGYDPNKAAVTEFSFGRLASYINGVQLLKVAGLFQMFPCPQPRL